MVNVLEDERALLRAQEAQSDPEPTIADLQLQLDEIKVLLKERGERQ